MEKNNPQAIANLNLNKLWLLHKPGLALLDMLMRVTDYTCNPALFIL